MDLVLFASVLKRHRLLVSLGFVLSIVLAFLAFVRIVPGADGPVLAYRQAEEWSSHTTLQVTETGFPEGRTILPTESADGGSTGVFADPGRLTALAALYVNLVDSDAVRDLAGRSKPRRDEKIVATQILTSDGDPLPFVDIRSIAPTAERAVNLVQQQSDAFTSYIRDQQVRNKVPARDRIALSATLKATKPLLISSRSKQLPMIVFLSAFAAVIALTFAVDATQRRRQDVERPATPTPVVEDVELPRWRDVGSEEPSASGTRSVA
jgi:hypothetical protein